MKIYITNHTKRVSNQPKLSSITYHWYSDCSVLNADYIQPNEIHLNSGVSTLDFADDNELQLYFANRGMKANLCAECAIKGHDDSSIL